MPRITPRANAETPFQALFHDSAVLRLWNRVEAAFDNSPTFDAAFLEQLRRVMAYANGCEYCMAKGQPADPNPGRVEVAVRFARDMALDHRALDRQRIEELKQYFSEPEISELVAYCAFTSASQKVGAVLGLEAPVCDTAN